MELVSKTLVLALADLSLSDGSKDLHLMDIPATIGQDKDGRGVPMVPQHPGPRNSVSGKSLWLAAGRITTRYRFTDKLLWYTSRATETRQSRFCSGKRNPFLVLR